MRRLVSLVMVLAWLGLAGCAVVPAHGPGGNPGDAPQAAAMSGGIAVPRSDPWERFNRKVFALNEELDAAFLRPVARIYNAVVPDLVQTGVENVFSNVSDAWSAVNHLLQGKAKSGLLMTVRFATNTLVGLGGLLDVATDMGLEREREDFGQTLGRWGLGPGPYLVLPLLGPSSLRDTAAMPLNLAASLPLLVHQKEASYALSGLQVLQTRADLLGAGRVVSEIALDKYVFLRDAYLARRRNEVFDGDPPPEPEDPTPDTERPR